MTCEITFLHTADLHLGAPVRGLRELSAEWESRLQRAIVEAYERMIEAALTHQVDFVVIAGDVFDTTRPSYGDYVRFFEGIEKLDAAGIPTYLVTGNHDPYTLWGRDVNRLPASAHVLGIRGPEFALFSRDGKPACLIGGRSYYNQTWPAEQGVADGITRKAAEAALGETSAPFSIGIIHTGLEIDQKKAPADESMLLASGIDYWACGHLHRRFVRPDESNPRIVFPGCLQGRDIKETGERGCYLVTLAQNRAPQLEFVPTASVVLEAFDVDVTACQTLADVSHLVQSELFRANARVSCDEMVVRITLRGATLLHEFLRRPTVIADLRKRVNDSYPSFFCDALVDRTVYDSPAKPAVHDGLFASIVTDIAEGERSREETLINYVQNEFVKRGVSVPSALSRRVAAFSDEAEMLVIDLLREESD